MLLGIDTSNYTTSAAVIDYDSGTVIERRKLLPVQPGERGLRQSEAVFHHNAQLPALLEAVLEGRKISSVAVSVKPRPVEGSYMPCFTVGEGYARAIAAAAGIPIYRYSHQEGHIAAVLFASGRLDILANEFYAIHLSGGTTELLHVKPMNKGLAIDIIGATLDVSAGQVIDRLGVRCGLPFPCGKQLSELSQGICAKPKDCSCGANCNLSGLENLSIKMVTDGASAGEAAAFVFASIAETLVSMLRSANVDTSLPIVVCGGVMGNQTIKTHLSEQFNIISAPPQYSADNAVGTAALAGYFGR